VAHDLVVNSPEYRYLVRLAGYLKTNLTRSMISNTILATVLLWGLSGTSSEADDIAPQASTGGSIAGRVTVPVTKVKKRTLRGSAYRSRLGGGGEEAGKRRQTKSPYSDVVVSAHPLSFTANPDPVTSARVDQDKITFTPRVLPVTAGSTVEFVNKDRVYHNVFSLTDGAEFNIGRKRTGYVHSEKIEAVGPIGCSVISIRR